ncbi:hypothetical protein [Salinarimonas rosea]|uniref:hypothetical protein n=1 Tax=Salinarimonas rosea TaxID=552063 RepID=UPI00041015AF|nr:hypothetical protein [Salinarimonas rosea]
MSVVLGRAGSGANLVVGRVAAPGGALVDIARPRVEEIDLEVVADALARIPRFGGRTHLPYSVGLHSLAVSMLVSRRTGDPRLALAGLLHDGHEAYVGDTVAPYKLLLRERAAELARAIDPGHMRLPHELDLVARVEAALDDAIAAAAGLVSDDFLHPEVKRADRDCVYAEAIYLELDAPDPEHRVWVPADYRVDPALGDYLENALAGLERVRLVEHVQSVATAILQRVHHLRRLVDRDQGPIPGADILRMYDDEDAV